MSLRRTFFTGLSTQAMLADMTVRVTSPVTVSFEALGDLETGKTDVALFLDEVSILRVLEDGTLQDTNAVVNGSFESPAVNSYTYISNPTFVDGWRFEKGTGEVGLDVNGGPFVRTRDTGGRQAAYLQLAGGRISQTVPLPPGRYCIRFVKGLRDTNQPQWLNLSCNQKLVRTYEPAPYGVFFAVFTSPDFIVL